MQISDRLSGLFLIGLGAAAWYGGSLLPPVPGQQVGPNVFPMVVGGGLVLCGALIALGVGSRLEKEAAAELAAHSNQQTGERRGGALWWRATRILLPPAMIVFYVFAVDRLGFVPTGVMMVLALSLAMGASVRLALGVALVAPPLIHLVFSKLLRVPLPTGFLPMPW